jgi:hypothetical protein
MSASVGDIFITKCLDECRGYSAQGYKNGPNVVLAAGLVVDMLHSKCVIAGVLARSVKRLKEPVQGLP